MPGNLLLSDLAYYLFVFLFPILPEYCYAFGRPIYDWVVLVEVVIFLLIHRYIKDKKMFVFCSIGYLLYFITYGVHGEWKTSVTVFIECFMVILVVYNEANTPEKIKRTFNILLFGGLLLCLEGLVEYFSGYNVFSVLQTIDATNSMGALSLGYRYGHVRIEGSFGQCLPFAMYLLFINGISLYMLQICKESKLQHRNFYIITYMLSIVCIYLTTARLVLALTIVLQFMYVIRLKPEKKLIIFFFGVLAVIMVVLTSSTRASDVLYTILSVFDSKYYSYTSDNGQNIAYRLQLFSELSKYIKQNVWFGMGYAEKSKLTFLIQTPNSVWLAQSIDNNYLSWLVEYGVVGVISNLYVLVVAIWTCVKARRNRKTEGKLKSFSWFFIILVLYAVNLMSVYQMGEKLIFYIFIAVIYSMNKMNVTVQEKQ